MQMEMKTPLGGMKRVGREEGRPSLFKYAESATALRLGREEINPDRGQGCVNDSAVKAKIVLNK